MTDAAPPFRARIAATLAGLELARLQARQFLERRGLETSTLAAAELVLEECVTNTLRYGYEATGPRSIEVTITMRPGEIDITLEDDARAFDPLSVPEPALPTSLDEARPGGLGLLMVKRTAKRMAYERIAGRNRLLVVLPRPSV